MLKGNVELHDRHQSETPYRGQVSHPLSRANHFGKKNNFCECVCACACPDITAPLPVL